MASSTGNKCAQKMLDHVRCIKEATENLRYALERWTATKHEAPEDKSSQLESLGNSIVLLSSIMADINNFRGLLASSDSTGCAHAVMEIAYKQYENLIPKFMNQLGKAANTILG